MSFQYKFHLRVFPGGPGAKSPPCNAGDASSIPGWGSKMPHITEQLSGRIATSESEHYKARSDAANKNVKKIFFSPEFMDQKLVPAMSCMMTGFFSQCHRDRRQSCPQGAYSPEYRRKHTVFPKSRALALPDNVSRGASPSRLLSSHCIVSSHCCNSHHLFEALFI